MRGLHAYRSGARGGVAALMLATGLFVLAACSSGPPVPDWRTNATGHLQRYEQAWLAGRNKTAAREFAKARNEVSRTGRADLVARVELTRCALQVASLEFGPCPGFAPLAQDAGAAERSYAHYLQGDLYSAEEAALLPAQHRAIATGGNDLAAIEEPLARLVAAGVLLQQQRIAPAQIEQAAQTASEQGWRRPLLAWLGLQLRLVEQAGDDQNAAHLRRRMDLLRLPETRP